VPSFTDLHIEFLFTVLDRFVFGGRLKLLGGGGDWPMFYNFKGRGLASVI